MLQNQYSPSVQPQPSLTVPVAEIRSRIIYAVLCYVAAVLLMSLLAYLYIAGIRIGDFFDKNITVIVYGYYINILIGIIVLAVVVCLITIAYYLIQMRYTTINRSDLFRHIRKLLPFAISISVLICVLAIALFWELLIFFSDQAFFEYLLRPLIVSIGSLIALIFSFKKARSIAKQIPAVPSSKFATISLLLISMVIIILPAFTTATIYNRINGLKTESQNKSYADSKLWTFVPTSSTHSLSLMENVVFPEDGIWYFNKDNHIAYHDFSQKSNIFISRDSYNNQYYKSVIYGDYYIFRPTSLSSETVEPRAEYTILNNNKTNAVKAILPRPLQVYDLSGSRRSVLPSDSYALCSADNYKQGKNKDTILVEILVSINQRCDYDQYIEINLINGKVTQLDKQNYDDAQYNSSTSFDLPMNTYRKYGVDNIDNKFYVIDNETDTRVEQPAKSGYCEISGGEKYLICDTKDLQWWPDKNKIGFVYWPISEIVK